MHSLLEKEHKQLIDLLDALDKCLSTGNSRNEVHKYMSEFVALATEEFKKEEELMEAYEYIETINHKKEHAELLKQLTVLKNKLDSGHTPFSKEYMQSLRSWLEEHLFGADKRLDKFLYQLDKKNSNKIS
jgi:hemerythrin-like metal-binding protein